MRKVGEGKVGSIIVESSRSLSVSLLVFAFFFLFTSFLLILLANFLSVLSPLPCTYFANATRTSSLFLVSPFSFLYESRKRVEQKLMMIYNLSVPFALPVSFSIFAVLAPKCIALFFSLQVAINPNSLAANLNNNLSPNPSSNLISHFSHTFNSTTQLTKGIDKNGYRTSFELELMIRSSLPKFRVLSRERSIWSSSIKRIHFSCPLGESGRGGVTFEGWYWL